MSSRWNGKINDPIINTDLLSTSRLAASEFGRDFLPTVPCFYVIGIYLGAQGDPVATMGLHRGKEERPFSTREKKIVALLVPHLSQALYNLNLIETLTSSSDTGMIMFGEVGDAYMNEEAKRALNGEPVASVPEPGLSGGPTPFRSEKGAIGFERFAEEAERRFSCSPFVRLTI